jgi:hypothetical protein
MPGDTVSFTHDRTYLFRDGSKTTVRKETAIAKITEPHILNHAIIFEFKDKFGMKDGIGVVAGER